MTGPTDSEQMVRAFSNGTEWREWQSANCNRCTKGYNEEEEVFVCEIDEAMSEASITGGLSKKMAERVGYFEAHKNGQFPLAWPCLEFLARS